MREKPTNKRRRGGWWRGANGWQGRQKLGTTVYVNFVPTAHHKGNKREQLQRRQVQFAPRYYKKVERVVEEGGRGRNGESERTDRKED